MSMAGGDTFKTMFINLRDGLEMIWKLLESQNS